jgi:hypothetical protein
MEAVGADYVKRARRRFAGEDLRDSTGLDRD